MARASVAAACRLASISRAYDLRSTPCDSASRTTSSCWNCSRSEKIVSRSKSSCSTRLGSRPSSASAASPPWGCAWAWAWAAASALAWAFARADASTATSRALAAALGLAGLAIFARLGLLELQAAGPLPPWAGLLAVAAIAVGGRARCRGSVATAGLGPRRGRPPVVGSSLLRQAVAALLAQLEYEPLKIEIVKAVYGAGSKTKDVTEVLRKQVGGTPLIAIKGNYNKAFGGDPARRTPKQLTIEYKINGKPGKVTLKENAPILLPMVK